MLQFYVSANGRSGIITEHGIVDGTTPTRLLEWIAKAMDAHPTTNGHNTADQEPEQLRELVLQTTPEIDRHAAVLGERYRQATSAATYVREQLDEFGTDLLLRSRAPVKGVIDLTFQLAVRLFFGRNMASWEPTSGALFHAGRADAMQRATPAVNAFCDAAAAAYCKQGRDEDEDGGQSSSTSHPTGEQLRALLSAATKSMNAGMQILLTGRNSQRVFRVLDYLWPAGTEGSSVPPKPAFLSDRIYFGGLGPPVFAQTNSLEGEMVVEDFVHIMPDPEGFWSFMTPEKNR